MNKIPVTPEGRPGIWLVEPSAVATWLETYPEDKIHNFICGSIMIGADWERASVIEHLGHPLTERVALMTGNAQSGNMGHALAVIHDNTLYAFDIGPITEADLEILP